MDIIDSLKKHESAHDLLPQEVESYAEEINELLNAYNLKGQILKTIKSPLGVNYEISLEKAISAYKVNMIKSNSKALLNSAGIRFEVTPGKKTIFIEKVLTNPVIVGFKDILELNVNTDNMTLPVVIGISAHNQPVIIDLAESGNILMGGISGMGKSMLLNSLILSLLHYRSENVKFLLIDPKMVEFTDYQNLNRKHFVSLSDIESGVISDVFEATSALEALKHEMEQRYELLRVQKARNISEYNKICSTEKMPYIVTVIDEFADLLIVDEDSSAIITRLASLGRAVGTHMVISTVRPSTSIINGAIRANFYTRIAFKTYQKRDSKVIIDTDGAETLTIPGEMLMSFQGEIEHIKGAYLDPAEISAVCNSFA